MANLAGKISEVKLWGRGSNAVRHRSPSCKGKQFARRDVNRAERKAAKQELARYADEIVFSIPMGEDCDAHVQDWERETFYGCGPDCTICEHADSRDFVRCPCVLCLADDGVISWASAMSIYAQGAAPCDHGLTPADFGC